MLVNRTRYMFTSTKLVSLVVLLSLGLAYQAFAGLVSGPMLTHVEMREARIWVQTDSEAQLTIRYRNLESGEEFTSASVEANPELGNTALLTLNAVEPGRRYSYQVLQDGTAVGDAAEFTSPTNYFDRNPPPDFRFAVGGSHYAIEEGFEPPYQLLGGGYGIFQSILQSEPKFMIWAGNTAHLRKSDYTTQAGTIKRFTTARQIDELAPLLSTVPNYAVWGSSDFSPREAGRHYAYRSIVESSFDAFWPRPVKIPGLEGRCSQFRYSDCEFFLLDVQSYRDLSTGLPAILGEAQINWLRNSLRQSDATFKFIISGAPALNPASNPSNLSYANREHTQLMDMLRAEKNTGTVLHQWRQISWGNDQTGPRQQL